MSPAIAQRCDVKVAEQIVRNERPIGAAFFEDVGLHNEGEGVVTALECDRGNRAATFKLGRTVNVILGMQNCSPSDPGGMKATKPPRVNCAQLSIVSNGVAR